MQISAEEPELTVLVRRGVRKELDALPPLAKKATVARIRCPQPDGEIICASRSHAHPPLPTSLALYSGLVWTCLESSGSPSCSYAPTGCDAPLYCWNSSVCLSFSTPSSLQHALSRVGVSNAAHRDAHQ